MRRVVSIQRATHVLASINKQCNDDTVMALCSLYWMLRNRRDNGFPMSDEEIAALNYVDKAIGQHP